MKVIKKDGFIEIFTEESHSLGFPSEVKYEKFKEKMKR